MDEAQDSLRVTLFLKRLLKSHFRYMLTALHNAIGLDQAGN